MKMLGPLHFQKWIDENRDLLKPPVRNKVIYPDADFIIMVVGGPNTRADYHINEGEEFFYQLEGDITLKVINDGRFEEIPIRAGEIFLLPPKVPHSPQRPENTVGLVIEKRRRAGEQDGFQWYCQSCQTLLYEEFFHLTDIMAQLPPLFKRFYQNEELTTCKKCGKKHVQN